MGRAAVCAGGRRPAREIATREPAARSGRSRGPPWPCHRPPAPRLGPAFCSSPVPSGPSGALHTSGARSLLSGSARVVTNVVNPSCFLCRFSCACYKRRQSDGIFAKNSGFWPQIDTFVTRVLKEGFKMHQFDDVCNVGRPLVARPGPAAAHGLCGMAFRSLRRPACRWGPVV